MARLRINNYELYPCSRVLTIAFSPPEFPAAAAAEALAAADAPPPFSGPATPSAMSMLSSRISCGSGGSSSCVLRNDRTVAKEKRGHGKISITERFGAS